jgi:hypothetical protein
MIIQDLTGNLLGHMGTIISNNELVADAELLRDTCTFVPTWNAFDCATHDFGVLEWNANSADKSKFSNAPVTIENNLYKNKINMWREWEW